MLKAASLILAGVLFPARPTACQGRSNSISGSGNVSHQRLRLDGSEASLATGAILFVRRIDDSSFDVIGKVTTGNTTIGEVSHFAFSPDGLTLTETKTQTETEPEGRTSVSVLIFNKTG